MSRRRTLILFTLLALWLLLVLPIWLIGLGYEANGFRLPMIGRDRVADILIFYVPIFAASIISSGPVVDRFRQR